jgi:hypothetical protein
MCVYIYIYSYISRYINRCIHLYMSIHKGPSLLWAFIIWNIISKIVISYAACIRVFTSIYTHTFLGI